MPTTARTWRRAGALRSGAPRRVARRVLVERLRLLPAGSDVRPYGLPGVAWVLEVRWEWMLPRRRVMTLEVYSESASPGDIEEIVGCPLCAGRVVQPLFEPGRPGGWNYRVVRCPGCGLLYRNPGIRPERLSDLYSQGGYSRFLAGRYSRRRQEDYRLALDAFGELFADGSGRRLLTTGAGSAPFSSSRASAVST